jgi:hypothetical protein
MLYIQIVSIVQIQSLEQIEIELVGINSFRMIVYILGHHVYCSIFNYYLRIRKLRLGENKTRQLHFLIIVKRYITIEQSNLMRGSPSQGLKGVGLR